MDVRLSFHSTFVCLAGLFLASVGYSLSVLSALLILVGDYSGLPLKDPTPPPVRRPRSLRRPERGRSRAVCNSVSTSSSSDPPSTPHGTIVRVASPSPCRSQDSKLTGVETSPTVDKFSLEPKRLRLPSPPLASDIFSDKPLVSSPSSEEFVQVASDDGRSVFRVIRRWGENVPRVPTIVVPPDAGSKSSNSRSLLKPKTIRKYSSAPGDSATSTAPSLLHSSTFCGAGLLDKKRPQPQRRRTQPYEAPYFLPPPDSRVPKRPVTAPSDSAEPRKQAARSRTLPPPEKKRVSRPRSQPALHKRRSSGITNEKDQGKTERTLCPRKLHK